MARTGHGAMSALSLLSGVKRKSGLRAVRSVVDPERTSSLIGFRDQQLTQAGATEAFQVVLPVRVLFDRHLVRDPSKRNIGLRATKLLERGHGDLNLTGHAGGGGDYPAQRLAVQSCQTTGKD